MEGSNDSSTPLISDENAFEYYDKALESYQHCLQTLQSDDCNRENVLTRLFDCLDRTEALMTFGASTHFSVLQEIRSTLESSLDIVSAENNRIIDTKDSSRLPPIESAITTPKSSGLSEIAGLQAAKNLFKVAVVLPIKLPHLFAGGSRKISTRILLYGPPGTGKTQLVHALAAEIGATLYCVTCGDLLSSLFGETEKRIKSLFDHPLQNEKRSIIFLDEVDSVCRQRSSQDNEHCRRIKTELLMQLTRLEQVDNSLVFLVCATNCPWDIDSAFVRRFQHRLYIPLPDREARMQLFRFHSEIRFSDEDYNSLLDMTDGFSGSDIKNLIGSAMLIPINELEQATHWCFQNDHKYIPSNPEAPNSFRANLQSLPPSRIAARDVRIDDFVTVVRQVGRTVSDVDLERFRTFSGKFGS